MKDNFKHFDPNGKYGGFRKKTSDKKNRYNEFYFKANQIEKTVKEVFKLKLEIQNETELIKNGILQYEARGSNDFYQYEKYVSMIGYIDWVLKTSNKLSKCPLNNNLEKSLAYNNQNIVCFLSNFQKITNIPNLPIQRRIMSYKINTFDAGFLQVGTEFYIKYLDPLGLWFTGPQLCYELRKEKNNDLKYAIILYIAGFAVCNNKDSELNEYRVYYYKYLKSRLPTYYLSPSLNHIIIIMFLAFFEASLYKFENFKNMLFMAVRMGLLLGYDKLGLNESNKSNFFNEFHVIREAKIWDLIVLNCSALSSIMGDAIINCVPKIEVLSSLAKEYNSSPFLLQFVQPNKISKLPLIEEAAKNFTFLCINFNLLNDYHAEWRMEFNKCTFENIIQLYNSLPIKKSKEADVLLHEYRVKLSDQYSASELLTKDSKLIEWLSIHHFSKNWLTFGPMYSIVMFNLLLMVPEVVTMTGISAVDSIRAYSTIEPCHLFYFEKWYAYCSLSELE